MSLTQFRKYIGRWNPFTSIKLIGSLLKLCAQVRKLPFPFSEEAKSLANDLCGRLKRTSLNLVCDKLL
ncbi:MAG: hypothetical protein WD894_16945 [Pirellulales bacterium]